MAILTDIELDAIANFVIKLTSAERWRKIDAAMSIHDRKWIAGLKPRFEAMEKEALDNIDYYLAPFQRSAKSIIKGSVEQMLPDADKWRVTFEEFGQLLLPGIISDAGQTGLNDIIVGISFNIKNPRVIEFIDAKKFKFAKEINDTTQEALREQLRAGLLNGEGIPQLKKRVQTVFTDAKTWRAETIARTETGAAYNFGSFESYRQSGVVQKKKWLAALDSRTRDSHSHMNGQIVGLNEPFSNGLMYPGDPAGSAGEIINCFIDGQTRIFTSKGWKPIAEIKIGNMVLTHRNRFRRVTKILTGQSYGGEVVKIIVRSDKTITATPEHKVLMSTGQWKAIADIQVGESIKVLANFCARCHKPIAWWNKYCSASCCSKDIIDRWEFFNLTTLNHTGTYSQVDVSVVKTERWTLKKRRRLYNFAVDEDESYMACGMVVHNCRCALAAVIEE